MDETTADRIIRKLRNSAEPALSASMLANRLDVSVTTVNNHMDDLVSGGQVGSEQIGNAEAYYIPESDLPAHQKPDHTCKRCGRNISTGDFAKIEYDLYYSGKSHEPATADFFVFCRFCMSDFISWAHDDEGSMGAYPGVHGWEIPQSQLEEVREDPEIETTPGDPMDNHHPDIWNKIIGVFREEGGTDDWIDIETIISELSPPHTERESKKHIKRLSKAGYLDCGGTFLNKYRLAK